MTDLFILMTIAAQGNTRYDSAGLLQHLKESLGDRFDIDEREFKLLILELVDGGNLNYNNGSIELGINGEVTLCDQPMLHYILENMTPFRDNVRRLAKIREAQRTG